MSNLAQIIRDNPGCAAVVSSKFWILYKATEYCPINEPDLALTEGNVLATSSDTYRCADGDRVLGPQSLIEALGEIVGIEIRGV